MTEDESQAAADDLAKRLAPGLLNPIHLVGGDVRRAGVDCDLRVGRIRLVGKPRVVLIRSSAQNRLPLIPGMARVA